MQWDHLPQMSYSGDPPTLTDRRFWAQVERTDTCWNWLGTKTPKGYGQFHEGQRIYAHRWVYARHIAPIPNDFTVDHLCRNRSCVRPDHLEAVTRGENVRRAQRSEAVA